MKSVFYEQLCGFFLLCFVLVATIVAFVKDRPQGDTLYIFAIILNVVGAYLICGSLLRATWFIAVFYLLVGTFLYVQARIGLNLIDGMATPIDLAMTIVLGLFTILTCSVSALAMGIFHWLDGERVISQQSKKAEAANAA